MSENCRQRYRLATGEGLTPNPGHTNVPKYAQGGKVSGVKHNSVPKGFKKSPGGRGN